MEVFGVAVVTKNVEIAGRRISLETGRVAEQANGAVIIRQGDTVVLSTAVMAKEPREGSTGFRSRAITKRSCTPRARSLARSCGVRAGPARRRSSRPG